MKGPDPLLILVGMELADLRDTRRWSREEAVSRLRAKHGIAITAATLDHYENGRRVIPLDRLIALCALYEIPVPVLLAAAVRLLGMADYCPTCKGPAR
jgi:transcriptional regulator with XRE-family HTH domain